MDPRLTRVNPQRIDYLEIVQNGVIQARIESTVQRNAYLITVDEHPSLAGHLPIREVFELSEIDAFDIREKIQTMTDESYQKYENGDI